MTNCNCDACNKANKPSSKNPGCRQCYYKIDTTYYEYCKLHFDYSISNNGISKQYLRCDDYNSKLECLDFKPNFFYKLYCFFTGRWCYLFGHKLNELSPDLSTRICTRSKCTYTKENEIIRLLIRK